MKHIGHICIRQATVALNTQPSPSGDRLVPTKPLNTNFSGTINPYCGLLDWSCTKRQWISMPIRDVLCPSLLPPMNDHHMIIKVTNPGKGMVCHHTSSDPTKIRPFLVRVISTIWLVLTPCLFDLKTFATKWANKSAWRHRRISPMLGLVVLVHGLSTSKLFVTYRACNSYTSHTRLGMVPPVSFTSQSLPTLTTWELFASMHPHMYFDPVV